MYKIFLVLFFQILIMDAHSAFLSTEEFDRARGIPDPNTRQRPREQQRSYERQPPYPMALDQAEYYREVEMPAPNAGINYLREDHPLQENHLQEDPDL